MVGINNPNPKAALDVTGEIYMNGFSVMGLQQAAIADDVSLNELTSPGIYFRRAVPQKNLNYPALVFGMLEVFSCSVNLVIQRYTTNKSCPGDYLYNLHGQIAKEVNAQLGSGTSSTATTAKKTLYRVRKTWNDAQSQKGAFYDLSNAKKCADQKTAILYLMRTARLFILQKQRTAQAPSRCRLQFQT